MKNIRKFETTAAMDAATLEDVSVNYNAETNDVLTLPLGGGANSIKNYMRFVAVEDSQINLTSLNMTTGEADNSVDLKHSKDGVTWTQYDFNPIPLAAGETLYLKGNNENGFSNEGRVCSFGDLSDMGIPSTLSTGKFECHGNIMSLLYGDDFEDKTTIPSAGCFGNLFFGCTSLTTAPELTATTLTENCYTLIFAGCTRLTTAPELPATTLAETCYGLMFSGCTSLTEVPSILPATTLDKQCYFGMFEGCTSLTTAPELPATTLVYGCYNNMFADCTNLTTAPELPADTLVKGCYNGMFYHCTNLTTAPELPATTLAETCYRFMFSGCTSLNHITMLATDISANYSLYDWVNGVSSTGTFVKHPDMTSLPSGIKGIPKGWTVIDYDFKN